MSGRKASKLADTGEGSLKVGKSQTVVSTSLKARDILDQHAAPATTNSLLKGFRGTVLGYVTPWNAHGYDIAKSFGSKFSLVSPVWLQVTVSSNEDYLVGGAHDIDKGWMADVRKKGTKIVPRILFERCFIRIIPGSVVNPNTLNLDLDPKFWNNLDPNPGLCNLEKKKIKIVEKNLFS